MQRILRGRVGENFLGFTVGLTLVAVWLGLLLGSSARAADAAAILKESGVKGGLVVHLGCGDGKLTAALRANDSFLVQGLDADAKNVEAARKQVQSLGLYGKVTIDHFTGEHLPYVDNLVNLLVISGQTSLPESELLRVLAPNGVAIFENSQIKNQKSKITKPRPKEIDEWTHYLHDADNNAVAHDTVVGPPRHLQWLGSPRWSRHHDNLASVSALVSAGGRIFYVVDEGLTATLVTPSRWCLLARDAFNGTILWRQPIPDWQTRFWDLKSGPAQLPRRLVAGPDAVYATLGINVPLTALDPATGTTLRTYEGTQGTVEVLYSKGILFLVVDPALNMEKFQSPAAVKKPWWNGETVNVLAVEAASGKTLWRHSGTVLPLTLAVDESHVFFHDGDRVVSLNRTDGKVAWQSEPVVRVKQIMSFFAPTLVVQKQIVLFAGGEESGLVKSTFGATNSDTITAFDAGTGKKLWTGEHPPSGYSSPEDVLVANDQVWCGNLSCGYEQGLMLGLDLRTGKVTVSAKPDVDTYWFHHRCYRSKATDRYLMSSRTGIEFIDLSNQHWQIHDWIRGGCMYGIMPANGLIYTPPHDCICYPESKQFGFNAVAPASAGRAVPQDIPEAGRLEQGPAWAEITGHRSQGTDHRAQGTERRSQVTNSQEWPTFRHDNARSGSSAGVVPANLTEKWKASVGGRLSTMVCGEGRLLVVSMDAHTVHALDAKTGQTLWSYTVGARVDSPPTLAQGLALFGSNDGYVYCLRASDGALAWRFRAAPVDRRLMALEQLESVWPVPGSVHVADGAACFVAGRSMFLDGGLRFFRLDIRTGRKLLEKVLDGQDPNNQQDLQANVKWLNMPVALPDVLSSDGRYLYMRSQPFDQDGNRPKLGPISDYRRDQIADQGAQYAHLFSPAGYLDDSWFHRAYWIYGRTFSGGWNGYYLAGKVAPAGQLLVMDEQTVYAFGRKAQYLKWSTPLEYELFAADRQVPELNGDRAPLDPAVQPDPQAPKKTARDNNADKDIPRLVKNRWAQDLSFRVRAMVLAGAAGPGAKNRTLFAAGPPELVNEPAARRTFLNPDTIAKVEEQEAAWRGERGGLLWAVSAADGQKLAEYKLDSPPVWDGLIAAQGCLYVATMDGKVVCWGKK